MNINLLEHNSFSAKYMANWFEKKKISEKMEKLYIFVNVM